MSKFSEVRVGQKFVWPHFSYTIAEIFMRTRPIYNDQYVWNAVRISGDCSGLHSEFHDDETVTIIED